MATGSTTRQTVLPSALAGPQRTVLIVDDNESVTHALGALLRDAGYATVSFNSGLQALAHASANAPAAAVIDVHLPDISGLVLVKQLRERMGEQPPIIVVSGDTSMENLNALPLVGATYFFSKPLRPAQLLERLRDLLA